MNKKYFFVISTILSLLIISPVYAQSSQSIVLTADKTEGQTPLKVNFQADLKNFTHCGNTYTWDFGTGPSLAVADSCYYTGNPPQPTEPSRIITSSHTYDTPGTYIATLKVNSVVSNSLVITVTVSGSSNPPPTPTTTSPPPPPPLPPPTPQPTTSTMSVVVTQSSQSIVLTADKTEGQAPLKVNFQADLKNFTHCGNTYTWDFGTGPSLAVADSCYYTGNPPQPTEPSRIITSSHTYDTPGTYIATLKVNSVVSNSLVITVTVSGRSNPPPTPTTTSPPPPPPLP